MSRSEFLWLLTEMDYFGMFHSLKGTASTGTPPSWGATLSGSAFREPSASIDSTTSATAAGSSMGVVAVSNSRALLDTNQPNQNMKGITMGNGPVLIGTL